MKKKCVAFAMGAVMFVLSNVFLSVIAFNKDLKYSDEKMIEMRQERCKVNSEIILSSEESDRCASDSEEEQHFTHTPKPIKVEVTKTIKVRPRGPFFDFVIRICGTLLNHFKIHRIRKYFNILGKTLRGLGSGYFMKMELDRFRKFVKKKSVYAGKILRQYVVNFLHHISSGKPRINQFFFTMNSIFSIYDDNRMDDYIYELKKYGRGEINTIGDKTRWMFKGFIFGKYYRQKDVIRRDIKLKFQYAVIEYERRHKNNR